MNDSELYENYYAACYHYAVTNGTKPNTHDLWVDLIDTGDADIRINSWQHDTTKPTNDQLKVFTKAEVQSSLTLKNQSRDYSALNPFMVFCAKEFLIRTEMLNGNTAPNTVVLNSMMTNLYQKYISEQ